MLDESPLEQTRLRELDNPPSPEEMENQRRSTKKVHMEQVPFSGTESVIPREGCSFPFGGHDYLTCLICFCLFEGCGWPGLPVIFNLFNLSGLFEGCAFPFGGHDSLTCLICFCLFQGCGWPGLPSSSSAPLEGTIFPFGWYDLVVRLVRGTASPVVRLVCGAVSPLVPLVGGTANLVVRLVWWCDSSGPMVNCVASPWDG
ncbi:uncharacterized protein G2W53_027500 [Senna tora]|uniref:Uncharacterized protein n=1 Tax=Senna tora TaxID=362788 RepID=A0A834THT0_9FABA|nr:uncharacterized protein G2W53_027500 [Senna tora]